MSSSGGTNSHLYAGLPELPLVPNTEPARIALDAFRIAIASQVCKTLNIDIQKVYEAIQTGTKGCDCNLAIPRFKLKEDAKIVAARVADEVLNTVPDATIVLILIISNYYAVHSQRFYCQG